IAKRFNVLSDEGRDALAKIVIEVTLPFLIFSTFAKMDFSPELATGSLLVFILAFVNLVFLFLAGRLSSSALGLQQPQQVVHTLHTMFGNIVFLGFPLLDALFPDGRGIFYGAIYQLASNTVTFTYGVYALSRGTERQGLKSLINVNTIALFAGGVVMLLGIKVDFRLDTAFTALGKAISPLSMIYIGAILVGMDFKAAFKQVSVYMLCFVKLLVMPVLLVALYAFAIDVLKIAYDPITLFVVGLQAAMPAQTIVVVLSRRYGADYKLATSNLMVTTILSIVTLPLVYLAISWILAK
ncbi:MAG: AEC family transporter, partial [Bacteroidales bacterium]|nr:AEC family transporter [Bacteroidales bacterium]